MDEILEILPNRQLDVWTDAAEIATIGDSS